MSKLQLETVKISALFLDPANARQHSTKNIEAIVKSLGHFGQRKPIVVTGANIVVAGNGTLAAAKQLGWVEIEIVRTPANWSHEQVKAFALADNRTAELAEWDTEILTEQLLELDATGWDVFELGFAPTEAGLYEAQESEPPDLAEGDKRPYQQITFTLHNEQADMIYKAMAQIKLKTDISYAENDNSNANAIYAICREYVNE